MSVKDSVDRANSTVALRIANHMYKTYFISPREWRIVRDAVYSALCLGTDNGKAIDVLRVAHNAIGIAYQAK